MTQSTTKLPKQDAPVEAFRFAAEFAPGQKNEDGTVPFSTLARTANAVEHWYWGSCVHDFSGLTMAPVIPVDYGHSDAEALGLINNREVSTDGLRLSGLLTPFKEGDKPNEVIHKASKGVPYQASIFFDPWSCVVEDVPSGFTTEVNGKTFSGPIAVFRQWELKGLAVCMYGVDSGTSVEFSKELSGKTVSVTRFKKGEEVTTQTKSEKKVPSKTTGKFAEGDTKPEEEMKKEGEQAEETVVEVETVPEEEDPEEEAKMSCEEETKMSRKELGKKFIGAFGEEYGPKLFAKGYSFSQASAEYTKILQSENKALREENSKFKQSAKAGGGANPVSFSTGESEPPRKLGGLSGNVAKFAQGIKIPTK